MCSIDLAYIQSLVGEDELIRLTDQSGGTLNTAFVNACIERADAEVDSVLYEKYGEPLSFVSGDKGDKAKLVIKGLKYDIALYLIYNKKHDDEEMKDVYVRYSKTYKRLEQIRKGEFKLIGITTANSVGTLIVTERDSDGRIFSRYNMNWPDED